ncbi:MAG TPA: hypothetical protein VFQ61_10360 [Polyangiaceae bacterium]|nr:hypothetical protein [Polyangiaceae bacterium]
MRLLSVWLGLATSAVVFLPAVSAFAAEDDWDGGYETKAERRSGFTASVGLGFGLGSAVGYPNEISKFDDPAYESNTGAALGMQTSIWAGGALRDWFNFGLGLNSLSATKGALKARGSSFIAHIEAFPLWSLGGKARDLSFFTEIGAGSMNIEGGPEKAEGGLMSTLTLGSSFELLRLGSFALGPTVAGTYMYSQSLEAYGVMAGIRASFYGGP